MDDERTEKLTFTFEETLEKSTLFQFVISSCKEKYKNPLARLFDGLDLAGFSVVSDFEDEIYKKFIARYAKDDSDDNGRVINGLTRTLVALIENWKRFIDKYIFYPKGVHPRCSIDFLDCIVLNDRGTIDYAKSAKNLIAERNVSAEDKLKIVCVHCLPDEIMKLTDGKNFVELSEEKTYENTYRLVQFWKTFIKGGKCTESFEEMIKIVGHDNQVGLMFFWEKLTQKQKNRAIVHVFSRAGLDLQIRWLNDMTIEQQEWIMRKCGGYVLINLMENELWKPMFYEVATFARYLLSSRHYFEVIYAASGGVPYARFYFPTNSEHLQMFEHMWELAPRQAKDYVYQQEKALNLFWFLGKVTVYEFFKTFFTEASQAFKRKFLSTWNGMQTFSQIHTDNQDPKLFHFLVQSAFPNEQDAVEFKIRFMNEEFGSYIINDTGIFGSKKPLDEVLKNMFFTDEAVEKFKKQYLYASKSVDRLGDVTRQAFFIRYRIREPEFRSELVFDQIINYVRQYLAEEEIETFKKTGLCQNNYVKKVFLDVIKKDEYDLVDEFLRWSITDDELIAEYKSNFYTDELKYEFSNLIPDFVMKKDDFVTLTKFDRWCNMSDENRRKMGDMILKDIEKMLPSWRYMLYEERFDMATHFLKFCGRSTEEDLKIAKNTLFVDINWIYIIHGVKSSYELNREDIKSEEREALTVKTEKIFDWFDATHLAIMKTVRKRLKEEGYVLKKRRPSEKKN